MPRINRSACYRRNRDFKTSMTRSITKATTGRPSVASVVLVMLLGLFCTSSLAEAGMESEASQFKTEEYAVRSCVRFETSTCKSSTVWEHQFVKKKRHHSSNAVLPIAFLSEHAARNGIGRPLTS